MPRQLRSILAQLRLGILPLYIETGRGTSPNTIIMDGIMMGCRQDLLPFLQEEEADVTQIIKGSLHSQRILISSASARRMLAKYVGLSKGRYLKGVDPLSREEFATLLLETQKLCIRSKFSRKFWYKMPKFIPKVIR